MKHKHRKKISRIRKKQSPKRRKPRPVRRRKPVTSNKPTDPRVARALGIMRREGASASVAARREGIKLNTFRKGAGRFLYRSGPGKPWKVRSKDQLAFSMEVLTQKGRKSVIVRNSRERKLLHEYENALRMFRGSDQGSEEELKRFEGQTVGGHGLITDTKKLIELEEADQLDFESLYSAYGEQL